MSLIVFCFAYIFFTHSFEDGTDSATAESLECPDLHSVREFWGTDCEAPKTEVAKNREISF